MVYHGSTYTARTLWVSLALLKTMALGLVSDLHFLKQPKKTQNTFTCHAYTHAHTFYLRMHTWISAPHAHAPAHPHALLLFLLFSINPTLYSNLKPLL